MLISIIYLLVALFDFSKSQWIAPIELLDEDEQFTQHTGYQLWSSGYFLSPSGSDTANFVTCTAPLTSYINLDSTHLSTKSYWPYSFMNGDWMSMDLYFEGIWLSKTVQFKIGSFQYSYTYTAPTNYPISTGFCNNRPFEVKTLNFSISLANQISDYMIFTSSNTNQGQVSLRNVIQSRLNIICYPSCILCTGPQFNQCTSCYYGSPTNNICPPCPLNYYYMKYLACKEICDITHSLYSKGFCQYFSNYMLESASVSSNLTSPENLNWFLIYDPQHIDPSATIILSKSIYGIFKFNSGFYRYFKRIQSSYPNYQIGLKIKIVTFNEIPINCGIQFMINNTIFGSIYRSASGIQTNKLIIYNIELESVYLTYSSNKKYDLITYVDIPRYPFLFSATGNYTDDTAGWAIASIQVTTGYCHEDCTQCEVSFKCKKCYYGYYFYRDGSCISSCQSPYQKLNGSYCQDYDDETPYSYYLIKEYINAANDPGQYSKYTLISQSGTNFLKGSDIYYSYIQGIRVFGGPFVWAQAKFQRVHNIISPHHSVTIAFYILYGPAFPSDGNFIYTIENNTPVSKSSVDSSLNYDGSKYYKVYEKINHNSNTLTLTWECLGPNNEPVKAYCGFYNYYIAVHDCKPYCLQCTDSTTCTSWNSTYDANIVRFSQSECLVNQYYDKDSIRCLDCPLSCLTCTSKIDCQTCQPTYIQTKLGCICKINQYEESNQCFDCPIECNQCLSSTYCIECLNSNFRQLSNGQCNCMDGFYPIVSNPQCQLCHQFCKTCIGPNSDQCLTCNDIVNIENVGSTCRCPTGSSYQEEIKTCSSCHSSCLSCFRTTIDGCLTCDLSLNRILKGLKCVCAPGYYELSNICTNCPNTEDASLSQCYKQCNNNQQIWHTITCTSCDSGFNLVYGECQPICGDSQIKGYEQCEDNNTILDDKCYNCQFQCPAHCLTCDQSTTLPCPDICGDGIITGNEECEDGNTIQYDGCFNCKYQCQTSCTKCIQGKCFECATAGWYIDPTVTPWQCKERCYDLQIVGSEQCDDGNLSDTDGCKECKYFCRIGCSSCDYTTNKCLSCEFPGFVPYSYYCKNTCGDSLVVTDPSGFYSEECDDGNTNDGDGCSSSCYFQCQPSTICTSCVGNRCEICATGYYLSNQKVCLPICGDSMIVVGEQCENSFILPYKGCINCQAKCQSSCLTCNTTGLGCTQCKNGYNKIDNLCYTICGDKIITEDEQCDDGNLLIGDGCHFCQFTCQDQCLNCIKGICYDCQEGYELIQSKCYLILQKNQFFINQGETKDQLTSLNQNCDINCMNCQDGICDLCSQGNYLFHNECISNHITKIFYVNENINLCGDNKIMDDEECEDNNIIPFDGCYYCKFQCDINCNDCQFGKCQGCILGYILNANFICEPECGDGIMILYSNEQCDLDIEWCINCQFKCQPHCSKQCFQCQEGFYPYLTSCIPICGDGIVIDEYEDCDDQNDQPNDGCFECQFECSKNCEICEKRICHKCDIDYVLQNNQCLFIKQKDDIDSNIIEKPQNNDTINYSVNPQWLSLNENKICREYECVYSKKPSMKLTFKKQYFALQYVEITFDQEVKFRDQLSKDEQLFNISIDYLDQQSYNITINSIQDIQFDLQYAQYQVVIQIFSQLSTKPVLQVQLNHEIVNSNNQTLLNPIQQINLQPPKIITEQVRQVSNYAQQSNKAFMIGAISLCVISLVSGESSIVVETLNLLQYQSYLRFINVDYPENLQIYFQAQELLSISSYLKLFEIDDYLNLITRKEKQINLSEKFEQYNIEADLFTNILPQLIQILGLVTLLFFAKSLYSKFFLLSKYMRVIQHKKTLQSKILFTIIKLILFFRNFIKSLMKIRYLQNYDQIIQLIYINSWDLIFKVILQFHYNQIENLRSILTTFFASLIFFICISFLLKSFNLFGAAIQSNVKAKLEKLEIKFIIFDICRTMFFHTVLILFQNQQILQCLLISFSSISQCYLIQKYKQCSKSDKIIFLHIEGILTAFSLSLFLYLDIGLIDISYENKVFLGFIQMIFLILSLAIVFTKQLIPKTLYIWKLLCKKKKVKVATSQLFS